MIDEENNVSYIYSQDDFPAVLDSNTTYVISYTGVAGINTIEFSEENIKETREKQIRNVVI